MRELARGGELGRTRRTGIRTLPLGGRIMMPRCHGRRTRICDYSHREAATMRNRRRPPPAQQFGFVGNRTMTASGQLSKKPPICDGHMTRPLRRASLCAVRACMRAPRWLKTRLATWWLSPPPYWDDNQSSMPCDHTIKLVRFVLTEHIGCVLDQRLRRCRRHTRDFRTRPGIDLGPTRHLALQCSRVSL